MTDARAAVAALRATIQAAKRSAAARSPRRVELGARAPGGDHGKQAVKFAEQAVATVGQDSSLGQDYYHRLAAGRHEAASKEHYA